jgi:hypothetical protein
MYLTTFGPLPFRHFKFLVVVQQISSKRSRGGGLFVDRQPTRRGTIGCLIDGGFGAMMFERDSLEVCGFGPFLIAMISNEKQDV